MKLSYTGKPLSERHSNVFRKPAQGNSDFKFARKLSLSKRVAGNSIFKRNLVRASELPGLLADVKNLISLFKPTKVSVAFLPSSPVEQIRPCVYKFFHKGIPITLKWVGPTNHHGGNYAALRHDFLAHQRAVRSGQMAADQYILRSPKVYGKEGEFLVMEFVDNIRKQLLTSNNENSFDQAQQQLRSNLNFLNSQKLLHYPSEVPQVRHLMTTGMENGKWVFYLPYDYR